MKSKYNKTYPLILALIVSCDSTGSAPKDATQYTYLKDCTETVANDNAAFSELRCPKIGGYDVSVRKQSPQFITISLGSAGKSLETNFNPITRHLPIEYGGAIEWRLVNDRPKYMVFRLAWGTPDAPFVMTERLVINLVASDRICPLAVVSTKAVKNANQVARDLIGGDLARLDSCPSTVLAYPR